MLVATCESDWLERSCLKHEFGVSEVFCDAEHANTQVADRVLEWRSCGKPHLMKHGSLVQSTVALSSGRSGYCASLRFPAHSFGIKAILSDWCYGVNYEIHMRRDSSAARDTSARQGLGNTRHDDMRFSSLHGQGMKDVRKCQSRHPCRKLTQIDPTSVRCSAWAMLGVVVTECRKHAHEDQEHEVHYELQCLADNRRCGCDFESVKPITRLKVLRITKSDSAEIRSCRTQSFETARQSCAV